MSQNKMFKRPDTERRWIENWVLVKDPGDDTPPDPPIPPGDWTPFDPPPEEPGTDGRILGFYLTSPIPDGAVPIGLLFGYVPLGYIKKQLWVVSSGDPIGELMEWWQPPYVVATFIRVTNECDQYSFPGNRITTHYGIVPTGFYRILRLIPADGQRPSYYLEWYQPNLLDNPNIGRA